MQLPQINIQSTDAKIGLRQEMPGLKIKQTQAELSIKQRHVGQIQISHKASQLFIDQTEAFADANLISPLRSATEFSQRAKSSVDAYLAKSAQQGDQMMRIENGKEAIIQIAKTNSEGRPKQFTLGYMPRSMSQVKFDYDPGKITINAQYKEPDITVHLSPPQIDIPKWQTEAYIRQKNQISFEAVGVNVNRSF